MMQEFNRELGSGKIVSLLSLVLRGYLIFRVFSNSKDQRVESLYTWKLLMCFLDHSCHAFATLDQISGFGLKK